MEETLAVAAAVRAPQSTAPSHEPQDGGPKSESSSSIQLVAEILGIQRCFRTLMGNEMIRGVSGGEKKRTSIAEVFMAAAPIQSWDNTTRGLDSLTALRIIEALRKCASVFGTCVMISVYQASQAIYDQFDKVSLLYLSYRSLQQSAWDPQNLAEDENKYKVSPPKQRLTNL